MIVQNGVIESCLKDLRDVLFLDIPESLDNQTIIGITDKKSSPGVFSNNNIKMINLPSTMKKIGDYSFAENDILEVSIPNETDSIGNYAFDKNENLSYIDFNNNLKFIGSNAFSNNNLKNVELPNTIEYIGHNAFTLNNISTLLLPNTITYIGDNAFYNNSIQKISFPSSINFIGEYAFSSIGFDVIDTVIFESNSNLNYLGANAFYSATSDLAYLLPTHYDPNFINYKSSDNQIYSPGDTITDNSLFYYSNAPYTLNNDDVIVVNGTIVSCVNPLPSILIKIPSTLDNQTIIGIGDGDSKGVFENRKLIDIQLPETLQKIGDNAFKNNDLSFINIPTKINDIGDYAFYSNKIKQITLGNSIEKIGHRAFSLNIIDSLYLPDQINEIGDYCFSSNELKHVHIPESLMFINNGVFSENSLDSVFIPNSVKTIGDFAFDNNKIRKIHLPESLKRINSRALASNLIESIDIPNSVTTIGFIALGFNEIMNVTLSDSLKRIESWAFIGNNIESITFPKKLLAIGSEAFRFNKLTNVTIPNSVKVIGSSAFYSNNLNEVFFEPNSNIFAIHNDAFDSNAGLTHIIFPSHSNISFENYKDINNNTYHVGDSLKEFKTRYLVNLEPYTLTGDDVIMKDGYIDSCINIPSSNIIIPEMLDNQKVIGVSSKEDYGVFQFKGINTITLPNNIIEIGERAFILNELATINLPDSIETIGKYSFSNNCLTSLTIPKTIKIIDVASFERNYLTEVIFENNSHLIVIQPRAFINNPELKSIALPTSYYSNFLNYRTHYGDILYEGEYILSSKFDIYYAAELDEATVIEKENTDLSSIKHFPNPVQNKLTITSSNLLKSISIYNTNGTVINSYKTNSLQVEIDFAKLTSGIYFVQCTDDKGETTTQKVIKK